MNKPLSPAELSVFVSHVMTRREKLMRFANLVRASVSPLYLFSGLEYLPPISLTRMSHPHSAFAVAAADGILKDAGLASDTVADAQKFFELSQNELHEFSCDCGGHISNQTMADRIERIAARSA